MIPRWLKKLIARFRTPPAGRIAYCLPRPAVFRKNYNKSIFFKDVDWTNWTVVVDGFQERFDGWYFDNMGGHQASYMDFCSLCALVDAFTHYTCSKDWHDQPQYKEFLRKLHPIFRTRLSPQTEVTRWKGHKWVGGKLTDYADVFYAGVRCSLHHHGDLAPYVGMTGLGGKIAEERPNAGVSQCGRFTYTLVLFDPGALKAALHDWFKKYCADLKANPASDRAVVFKRKFQNDFGLKAG